MSPTPAEMRRNQNKNKKRSRRQQQKRRKAHKYKQCNITFNDTCITNNKKKEQLGEKVNKFPKNVNNFLSAACSNNYNTGLLLLPTKAVRVFAPLRCLSGDFSFTLRTLFPAYTMRVG